MEKVSKKRAIKITLTILVVIGISLGLLKIISGEKSPEMSFCFLDGKIMTARIKRGLGNSAFKMMREVYSFEADFNDVCANVKNELTPLGFTESIGGPGSDIYEYTRVNSSTERLDVRIINRNILLPKSSQYSEHDCYDYHWRNGWLSIEIRQIRLHSWHPQYFMIRLEKFFRKNTSKAPPRNS